MASIKRSELEILKASADEAALWYHEFVDALDEIEEWRDRLWTAEQEIHDLKEYAEKCDNLRFEAEYARDVYKNECIELIDEYVDECSQHDKLRDRVEQLDVQLAGVSTAALGGTKEPATSDQWGWSRAYQDTLDLRIKYEELLKKYNDVAKPAPSWSAETYYSCGAQNATAQASPPSWSEPETHYVNMGLTGAGEVKPSFMKRHFSRIAISLLLLTVLGLGLVSFRQNQVIQYQREVLREAAEYILHVCPPAAPSSLSQAHQ